MAKKKDFNNTFDRITGKTEEPAAAPVAADPVQAAPKKAAKTAEKPPVFSFRIDTETADKIKDYAYTKRISIKEAVETMVDAFIYDYESDPNNEPLLSHKK